MHRLGHYVVHVLEAIVLWAERAIDLGWAVHLTEQSVGDLLLIEYVQLRCSPSTWVRPSSRSLLGVQLVGSRCKLWRAAKVIRAMKTEAAVFDYYRGVTVAASMRGHGVMIPFGLQCGTISLLSHDKVRAFLNDIGQPEWGVELQFTRRQGLTQDLAMGRAGSFAELNATAMQQAVTEDLTRVLTYIDAHRPRVYGQIRNAQRALLGVTAANLLRVAREVVSRSWQLSETNYSVYDRLDRLGKYHDPEFSLEAGLLPHMNTYFALRNRSPRAVRLLSLGCSLGHGVKRFAASGYDTYGVDVSNASIAQANQLGRGLACRTAASASPPCLQPASLTALPFESGWFQAGVSADVLEHLHPADVETAVLEISRVVTSTLFLRISTIPEKRKLALDGATLTLHLTVRPAAWWKQQFVRRGWRDARLSTYPRSNNQTAFLVLEREYSRQAVL